MIRFLSNLSLCLAAGTLWLLGNIVYGNLAALDYLGWLASYPWAVAWVAAIIPSLSQLYITENWGQERMDFLSTVFTAFFAIVVDLGGPMLGFYVTTRMGVSNGTLLLAFTVAVVTSILCQHVAWMRGKAAFAILKQWWLARPTPKAPARPPRLMDKLPPREPQQHPNGRKEEPRDPKEVARHD